MQENALPLKHCIWGIRNGNPWVGSLRRNRWCGIGGHYLKVIPGQDEESWVDTHSLRLLLYPFLCWIWGLMISKQSTWVGEVNSGMTSFGAQLSEEWWSNQPTDRERKRGRLREKLEGLLNSHLVWRDKVYKYVTTSLTFVFQETPS